MAALFDEDGIQFLYPENWELQREENARGWTVAIQSPETAFLVLSFDAEMPEMDLMAQTALDVLRAEYEDLEADDAVETVAGQPAVGHDVHFFSLDLTNTCWIRSFYCGQGTVLVMWQINDLELEHHEPVLHHLPIAQSGRRLSFGGYVRGGIRFAYGWMRQEPLEVSIFALVCPPGTAIMKVDCHQSHISRPHLVKEFLMITNGTQHLQKCSQCGLTEDSHRELYGTSLGLLAFTFRPDQGPILQGEVHLCRPCTHEVLSRGILHAAGISDEALLAETWK